MKKRKYARTTTNKTHICSFYFTLFRLLLLAGRVRILKLFATHGTVGCVLQPRDDAVCCRRIEIECESNTEPKKRITAITIDSDQIDARMLDTNLRDTSACKVVAVPNQQPEIDNS